MAWVRSEHWSLVIRWVTDNTIRFTVCLTSLFQTDRHTPRPNETNRTPTKTSHTFWSTNSIVWTKSLQCLQRNLNIYLTTFLLPLLLFYFIVFEIRSQYSPGWPYTQYLADNVLELLIPSSASQMLRLWMPPSCPVYEGMVTEPRASGSVPY